MYYEINTFEHVMFYLVITVDVPVSSDAATTNQIIPVREQVGTAPHNSILSTVPEINQHSLLLYD